MNTTILAATTSAAAASNAAAIASNQKNKIEECNRVLNQYNAQTATVKDMQEYSDCVDLVFPKTWTAPK